MARDNETVQIEARIEHTTAKAYLLEPTMYQQNWVAKSQVVDIGDADMDGNRMFTISKWVAEKNGWTEDA